MNVKEKLKNMIMQGKKKMKYKLYIIKFIE